MKKTTHPNFILGIISLLLLFIGVGLKANGFRAGDYVLMGAIGIGAIHWIWSVVDVFKDYNKKKRTENKNILWVILVLIVPPVGGLFYYPMGRKVTM
ncbi:MAG TPA: PLD nuclease N-terminal domain-containing protein [Flavisolibacter sp.]|nr:PLD nuclease N-terminal domain-containing protein [Flavisolibacter sp.]